jgi:hypothetical protein
MTRGKTFKDLEEIAVAQHFPATIEAEDVVEGWLGNLKKDQPGTVGVRLIGSTGAVCNQKKDDPNKAGKVNTPLHYPCALNSW